MVANFNPSWRGITNALRLAVIAAGGTPSVTTYPANWGGTIRAIDDLKAAITALNPGVALAAHVAAVDPHPQYALDSDLAPYATSASLLAYATTTSLNSHTSNTSNPHATTAAQVGAAATNDARLSDTRIPTDGTVTDAKVASNAAIGWAKISKSGAVAADVGAAATNDARLSDTRIPTDGTVTDAKVASNAAIGWAKVSKSGATAADVGAATAAQGTNSANHIAASANVHGLPASVSPLGSRNAAGEFIQHGSATATGAATPLTLNNFRTVAVTFPVAFSVTPKVFAGGSNTGAPVTVLSASATGFTMVAWGDATIPATYVGNYLALGT